MEQRKHYYILPDGTRANNMKDACEAMHIRTGLFKRLLKFGDIIKKDITLSTSSANYSNKQNGDINSENNR